MYCGCLHACWFVLTLFGVPRYNCEDWIGPHTSVAWTCSGLEGASGAGCDCSGCDCAVDCVGAWGAWSTCDATCGIGSATRSFEVAVAAWDGGAECTFAQGTTQEAPCAVLQDPDGGGGGVVVDCPLDCVGQWSVWGACSVSCGGGGTKKRIFAVETGAKYGGVACPISQTDACSVATSCVCPNTCIAGGCVCACVRACVRACLHE
jgi:hypothetical protein